MFTTIRLQQFRSYDDFAVDLDGGVNIIVGPNASGKTNLLEALLVVCRGESYRVADRELISFGCDWARLDAQLAHGDRTVKLERHGERVEKSFSLDGNPRKRLMFDDKLPVVLFEPEHLRLLTGSPELRRSFLDDLLTQLVAEYGKLGRQYRRALAQRNALLKKPGYANPDRLFVWNVRLSELGAVIAQERQGLIQRINELLTNLYELLSGKKVPLLLTYHAAVPVDSYASALHKKLDNGFSIDVARGYTAHGPHREDFSASLGHHPAASSASRGETRTIVLCLKLLELQLLAESRGVTPLMLLDDVFSELDGTRRRLLTEHLKGVQTIITTTDADVATKRFLQTANLITTS